MREIIQLQIGQCGNLIGSDFWQLIAAEHGVDHQGYCRGDMDHHLGIYFSQTGAVGRTFRPRCVLVDSERDALDEIRSGPLSKLFHPQNFVHTRNEAGGNW